MKKNSRFVQKQMVKHEYITLVILIYTNVNVACL